MKALVIGDPHLKHTNLKLSIAFLRWIEQVVAERKVDMVVNLGDTFNDHSVIRSEILCEFRSHLAKLSSIPYILIVGNHDQYKPNDRTYHSLQVFSGMRNVKVVDKTSVIDGMTFIPFLCKGEEWPDTATDLIFTHNTFVGADFGFKLSDSGIAVDKAKGELIISGHIHKRQAINAGGTQIIYPGTPYASSASDVDQEKGLMILDTETLSYYYIKSPFPMWQKWTISAADSFKDFLDRVEVENHHVVTVTGPKAEVKALLASKEVLDSKKTHSISFKTDFTDKVKNSRKSIKASSASSMVKDFIKTIYSGQVDKTTLESEAIRYLGEQDDRTA